MWELTVDTDPMLPTSNALSLNVLLGLKLCKSRLIRGPEPEVHAYEAAIVHLTLHISPDDVKRWSA